ncbi:MAG: T9SS type A sorting domain-containing protein, partial [Bacteroidales bacterium]|nr:T9SS type A sorting domain-containing protein [Bacteroidales bacterium]
PNGGAFSLELPVAATVEVFASNGILQQRLESGAGVVALNIERSGIYFIRVTGGGRAAVKRVIVR